MRLSTFILALLSISTSSALPTNLATFLLVTTTQPAPNANTSELKAVSATSLFDPFKQPALILRLEPPGYNSLPNFTLSSGTLSTNAQGPFGSTRYEYNSTLVTPGAQLQFLASVQPEGNLALDGGYLLTVGGEREGWTICEGELGEEVLYWRGDGEGCVETFVQAVRGAPY
ncbi:hypothetical protein T440DRAFT_447022 [Plenodomus tracheiphilus IPT5]|uniref:Pullulan synthetase n=1 Tax=Plenodomus tracheiphilus IPT5 TaxID=1408161 RepID=A0A6A7BAB9_9PLEO|nr:hypothetical protein T440DRAFT_447022 [Plenodomus tracheiphilus IPT5]